MTKGRECLIKAKRVFLILLAVTLTVTVLFGAFTSCKNEKQSERSACISATKRAVRAEFKGAEFKFCPDSEFSVREQDDGSYKVKGSLVEKKADTGRNVTHYFTAIVRGASYGDVTLIWG